MKTVFVDGSVLSADFLNKINGTTASTGLIFSGDDEDGCQPLIPRSGLQTIEHGNFSGRLYQLNGVTVQVDITFGYTISDGLATIWWSDIVIPATWRSPRTAFYNSVAPIMPVELRPLVSSTDPIVGYATYLTTETDTSPSSGSQAYTHLSPVKIYTSASSTIGAFSGLSIEFLKDALQPWNDQAGNTILAGQVTYQTGNLSY